MPAKRKKKTHKLGFAALAAAAAGACFLYGKDGIKNRKKVRGWALKAKGEVLEKLERAKHLDEKSYQEAVDVVARKYRALKNVDRSELVELVDELRGHWKSISSQLLYEPKTKRPAKRRAAAKKAAPKKSRSPSRKK